MPRDIIFPHVPKTAGTALRVALQKSLPNTIHLYDYGPKSDATSPLIRALRYEGKDRIVDLRRHLPSEKPVLVMGHFRAAHYMRTFAAENFITFVRKPVERVISDYKHFVRHLNFTGSLLEFARNDAQRNKQSFHISDLDIENIGFAGISEDFDTEVEYLGTMLGIEIDPPKINVAPEQQEIPINNDIIREIYELNIDDINLYNKILMLRNKRGVYNPPDGGIIGAARIVEPGRVRGWAVASNGRRIVPLMISQNGKELGKIQADIYRKDLEEAGISKTGLGGFEFFTKDYGIQSGPLEIKNGKILINIIV